MLCMLCHLMYNCIFEKCRYLLHSAAENATANELQYFSNKTNKQTEIYTLRLSFKTQFKD